LKTLCLRCWGEFALFTRPEFKVERVSYDVPTPSAIEGVLKAIFWKPEFDWIIDEVWLLKPIKHFSILRNEVKLTQSVERDGFVASEQRTQRHSLVLKDVDYLIKAHMKLKPFADNPVKAYEDQFKRRLESGQYFHHPYFGCREFVAFFDKQDEAELPTPIDYTADLGLMLTNIKYVPDPNGPITFKVKDSQGVKVVNGRAIAQYSNLKIEKGVIHVPQSVA
jgi:CRISPR-associated protein Cas5d